MRQIIKIALVEWHITSDDVYYSLADLFIRYGISEQIPNFFNLRQRVVRLTPNALAASFFEKPQ